MTQNKVSGAFFIIHWATQLPGGILAARYGTKLVFGLANWIGCVTCILVPTAAYLNINALIWLRLIQGFVAGAAWPCNINIYQFLPFLRHLLIYILPIPVNDNLSFGTNIFFVLPFQPCHIWSDAGFHQMRYH